MNRCPHTSSKHALPQEDPACPPREILATANEDVRSARKILAMAEAIVAARKANTLITYLARPQFKEDQLQHGISRLLGLGVPIAVFKEGFLPTAGVVKHDIFLPNGRGFDEVIALSENPTHTAFVLVPGPAAGVFAIDPKGRKVETPTRAPVDEVEIMNATVRAAKIEFEFAHGFPCGLMIAITGGIEEFKRALEVIAL